MALRTSSRLVWGAALAAVLITFSASTAAPKPAPVSDAWLMGKGAKKEGPVGPAILWLDEATKARGGAASLGLAEALIFHQPHDSGLGFFLKSDETFGAGTWATRMVFANGWVPGDTISSYEARILHSTFDNPSLGGADFMIELWDGDPMGVMETVCSTAGIPAPIPGTQGFITNVPNGALIQARVELPEKVTYDCDRAWMVMTMLSGCRATWRLSGDPNATGGPGFNVAPIIGQSDALWMQWPCEAFGTCGIIEFTHCCGTGIPCGQNSPPGQSACGDDSNTNIANTFCGTGSVYYNTADFNTDDDAEEGFVSSIFAASETTMFIVPVSVDAVPSASGSAAGVISLGGGEVVLQEGNHNVWLEIMIGNWDPHGVGTTLAGYQPALDMLQSGTCSGSGYSCSQRDGSDCPAGESCDRLTGGTVSGLAGQLTRYVGPAACGECSDDQSACYSHDDCTAGACSVAGTACNLTADCPSGETCVGAATCSPAARSYATCEAALGVGSFCGPAGYDLGTGTCVWTYIDTGDPRWALAKVDPTIPALDVSSIDARPAYAAPFSSPPPPSPFPAEGLYAATLALHVPADAKGTFTIGLKPFPQSQLLSGAGPPIPLLGIIPAKITVQTGRCCYNLQNLKGIGADCLDELQTADTCAQLPGITLFTADESCPVGGGPPCECDPLEPATFDDDDVCTDDFCNGGITSHTVTDCDDGLTCTVDGCASAFGCTHDALDCDDGLACTVDSCVEPGGCAHEPVDTDDGDPCTVDVCLDPDGVIIHQDLTVVPNAFPCPTGDPVADQCPSETTACLFGFCRCFPCGDGILDPGEMCDGTDDAACFGRCRSDCQCPTCGDGVLDQGEECDVRQGGSAGADDACPGRCQSDCTCPSTIPATTHWGLVVLALLLLIGAKLYQRRLII